MPRRPLHGCNGPACQQLTAGQYCPDHAHLGVAARRAADASRPTATDRGYGAKWRAARAEFLSAHPDCVDPSRRHPHETRLATQVDHITPHKGDQRLFWNRRNWQSLCASCGGYKSATEAGGRAEPGRTRELAGVSHG